MKFNKEAERVGHVFQDRYKSEAILDDSHLLQVVRYIHNNPVKAKIITQPEDYQWSSYAEYISGKIKIISQRQRDLVMEFFSNQIDLFKNFHQEIDYAEYLDTKEEIESNRKEIAQAIINAYCISKGINGAGQIINNREFLEELIGKLLEETRQSHRQFANLLDISNNIVHKVSLKK